MVGKLKRSMLDMLGWCHESFTPLCYNLQEQGHKRGGEEGECLGCGDRLHTLGKFQLRA